MSPGWVETYLGLIFQVYGLAFFVLGVAALLSMRRDSGTGLAAHLGWLAAFGMLHGLQEFIDGERLHNPAAWLVVLGTALMVVSFAALLEFGRRLWNERPGGRRLAALPLYAAAGVGTVALMLAASAAAAGLELGARYLLGAPGAALAGIGLLAQARATARAPDTVAIIRWLRIAALAMLGYAALTLFLSAGSGRLLADWLPTTADFLATTGLPVQVARALCAVLLAVGFVILSQRGGSLTAASLRRVTDRLDGFVYRCRNDRDWSVSFMSEGGDSLTGYPVADFLRGKRHFAEQIHPDEQQRVWDEVQAALAARRDFRLQYRMLDRAGTVRWCYEEGRGVFDAQGELLYLEGLVRNDDARHQAEDAQRRMQTLVEASPQPMGWSDPDGTVRYFNAALRTLLAVPEGAELSGYRLRDFYDAKAYEQIEATVLPAVAAQGAWIGEIELTALDGRSVPTLHSVFVLRDAAGGIAAFANVITDLSDIRAAQRDLHIKDTAIATATSAIALAGLDGALTYVNQAFVALWGLAGPEEAIGRSALSFWDEPDQAQAVVDTLAHTGRWQGELLGHRADGSRLDVQLTGHMVLDDDGKPLCMMGSFLDVTARNQAQQALQRERDFARNLLDTAPAIILLMDPRGMIRHVNPWFEQLTGYRLDEIVGKEWFATFLPARDQVRIRELFASALHDQPVRGNINPIVTRDGEERAIEWHAMPLRDADGQMTGLLSIGMDVTERQQLERELLRSETLLNSVIQQIPAMVFLKRASDLRFELFNRAGEELLGLEQTALLGKSDHDFFPLEQASAFVDKDQEVLASGQTLDIPEEAILVRNGETRILHTRKVGIYDAAGEPTHLLGISLDITEQKRTQEMMEFLARASSASEPDVFFRLCVRKLAEFYGARYAFIGLLHDSRQDVQTVAVWAGEDFAPNFEYNLVGTPCRDVLDLRQELIPHEVARLYPDDAMLVEMGVDSYYGAPLISSSGRVMGILSVMDTQAMVPTPWTAPLLGVFASRVAMELKRKEALDSLHELNTSLEQRVAWRTAELERANAAKSEFLSRMSHELRTPLNAILGFSQLLQLHGQQPLSAQQADSVREIHHAGEHLLNLVNEVLDLARIESGRLELNPEPVALCPLIERCAAQIAPMAARRAIKVSLQTGTPCTVRADPMRLQQVLLNLLSNAVKYNREGGRIEVECAAAAQQRVRVSVRDSGRGLSAEQQARLFRPFERLESAYDGIEGTGIGLALAKQLVEGMQGATGVDSVPGEGSCFWFELPLSAADAPGDAPAPAAIPLTALQNGRHKLLYIEDNPANLRLVEKILARRADIELFTAATAEDGLEIAGREYPDLILMDLNLPGMDGFEALQRLRADPATRNTPVIAVTANAMKRDIEYGKAVGFKDYLTKPINVQDFFATLERHLVEQKGAP